MESGGSLKRYLQENPKRTVSVPAAQLRDWIRIGLENKLERAVLAGQGRRLLAEDMLPLPRYLVDMITTCEAKVLESSHNRNKFASSYDAAGTGLLHKAVFYNYLDIVTWLVTHFPHLVHQRDAEGRTALHYTAACSGHDEATLAGVLSRAGGPRGARDSAGHTLAHYRANRTLLALPAAATDMPSQPNSNDNFSTSPTNLMDKTSAYPAAGCGFVLPSLKLK
ncbi:unnamed protein product [Leptidea sinapis]|uniref:Uncharacterized protein n=1 Tax=Leptidea sinapis TaxID=189913 RepID=A0A5E4Q511_9NEOP|nr:unnamed protein product [Leptidea sinapis]